MLRSLNVATPASAATVSVPLKLPPPGLAPIASVTSPVKVFTGFPSASRAVTCTAGVIGAPATVEAGSTVTCTVTATDNRGDPTVTWVVRRDGTSVASGDGDASLTITFIATVTGTYTVDVMATDTAGNQQASSQAVAAQSPPLTAGKGPFAARADWADQYARHVCVLIGRPNVTVDVDNSTVGY